jgi:four helix bundle protein
MENKTRTFEDLKVYQLAREFGKKVEELTKKLPPDERYRLVFQMRRAKLSTTNNIAEGYGRYHYQENIQFCRQARGSIYELIDDFIECLDCEYIDNAECNTYKNEAYQVIKVLNGYIAKTKSMKNHLNL